VNTYNLNIQLRKKEKRDLQQVYNSLVIKIEKQKNLFTINQKEILNKATLLVQINNQYIQNLNRQKDLLSKLQQEQSRFEQERLHKENLEKKARFTNSNGKRKRKIKTRNI
jgi:DNA integrity scanning protein DisA with diadenylate cyclase activity